MRALLDLLLPPVCPGCGTDGALLCERCRAPLDRRLAEPPGAPLGLPVAMPAGIVQLEWCAAYSGPVRAALQALKYGGERRLAQPLALAMGRRWQTAGRGGEVVTWVPVHPSRLRERGFDQAEVLARVVAGSLGLPARRLLQRRQRTVAQHALDRDARAVNIATAFAPLESSRRLLAEGWVLVVDDIVTTGATLAGCAGALYEAGALAVSALTLARDR